MWNLKHDTNEPLKKKKKKTDTQTKKEQTCGCQGGWGGGGMHCEFGLADACYYT